MTEIVPMVSKHMMHIVLHKTKLITSKYYYDGNNFSMVQIRKYENNNRGGHRSKYSTNQGARLA